MTATRRTYTLERGPSTDHGTPGVLLDPLGRIVCRMLELPWRDNATGLSCIPPGLYPVRHLPRSGSGKYRDVYALDDTGRRAGILIHKGNWAGDTSRGLRSHSHGCLLPCLTHGVVRGQLMGLASAGALARLHAATNRQPFLLLIRSPFQKPATGATP